MKIAVVGGGSTYTPELVEGFATSPGTGLAVEELALVDPAADRLAVVGPFAERILRHHGRPGRVTCTSDVDAGLDGATFVVIQLRVGGQAARIDDEKFPLACGRVGQETTGAGGLAKALRTVPVVLDIAERARALAAPDAWIIDFTNPVGIVTRALLDAGHRAIGLCNVAIGFQRKFGALLGVPPDAVLLDHVGLNHLTWERAAVVDGVDRLPELLGAHLPELAAAVGLPPALLAALRCVPSYYLRYFYRHDEVVRAERDQPTRGEQVARIEAALLRRYADPALVSKPELLSRRGGAFYSEAAVGLVAALRGTGNGRGPGGSSGTGLDHGEAVHALDVPNHGTLPFLPDRAVVEVCCRVGPRGAAPLPVPPLDPALSGPVAAVAGYEELAVAAAVEGGRDRVYRALLAHPLVGQHEYAETLTDRLLAANAKYLAWA